MAVNVVLGSLNALFDGTFDRIKCRNGVIKGIIIAACFVAFYVAGRLNPDIVAIDIDGETVNVATAANLAMVTAYVLYAKDVFSKLSKLVLSKTSGTPEQTGGTTPPALEEPADAAEATAAYGCAAVSFYVPAVPPAALPRRSAPHCSASVMPSFSRNPRRLCLPR